MYYERSYYFYMITKQICYDHCFFIKVWSRFTKILLKKIIKNTNRVLSLHKILSLSYISALLFKSFLGQRLEILGISSRRERLQLFKCIVYGSLFKYDDIHLCSFRCFRALFDFQLPRFNPFVVLLICFDDYIKIYI